MWCRGTSFHGIARGLTGHHACAGFGASGASGPASPGIIRSPSAAAAPQDRYGGFVARPTTPKGSSLPTANPLYHGPPKPAGGAYTPRRVGRLESLKDIEF